MIELEIERQLNYLSPSSLGKALDEPNTFYITRLIEDRWPRETQGLAASVGSALDTLIKKKIIKDYLPECAKMLPEIEKAVEREGDEPWNLGKKAMAEYVKMCYCTHRWLDVEIWKHFKFHEIPIYIKMDAIVEHQGVAIPHDWKCSGFASAASPKKGFIRQYKGFRMKPAHKIWEPNISIETIDPKWARQFTTYGWGCGFSMDKWEPFYVSCDMITLSKTGLTQVSTYLATATVEYQKRLLALYKQTWKELNGGSFIDRLASKYNLGLVYQASLKESWF